MKVAVIGGGISGIGAAWLLSRAGHEVHLFEAEDRLGGHAHTVDVQEEGGPLPVDTGFLVYNELTYPNLIGFFEELGVETIGSDMSLSIKSSREDLEWAGDNLNSVFGQRKNLFSPGFYLMLWDILRFGREAEKNLSLARRHAWSLGELLENRKYSRRFLDHYLLPIGAAIWSTPEGEMLAFPAETFLVFFMNHKLLQVNDRPQWRTVLGGSRQYVEKAARGIRHIHLSSPVESVERKENGRIELVVGGNTLEFDKVIFATHAPVTAKILRNKTQKESAVLGAIEYESNRTILHSDETFMPRNKLCWSSWNVEATGHGGYAKTVSLTYFINRLQSLKTKKNYFVTLNPVADLSGILEFIYAHPKFDRDALRAQRSLDEIQGTGGVYFAGAWTRYGFHEDGLLSGVRVCERLGVTAPWNKEKNP